MTDTPLNAMGEARDLRNDAAMPPGLQLQPRAARTLAKAIASRAGHAYLLSGTPGAGTAEAAIWIAAASLCPNGGSDDCDVCRRVQRRVHPDLIWVSAEGQLLAREQIDQVVEQLVRRPFEAAMQVAVIEDAETLSSTNSVVGNALLKVLEEPPGDVLFVLLARSSAQLLPTLRSRVIEVAFPPLADAALTEWLRNNEPGDSATLAANGLSLESVVRIARGDLGMARQLLAGGTALHRHQRVTRVAAGLAGGSVQPHDACNELHALIDAAATRAADLATEEFTALIDQLPPQDGNRFKNAKDADGMEARIKRRARRAMSDEARRVLVELATWYRDLLAMASGADDTVVNVDCMADLHALRTSPAAVRAIAALDAIEELPARLSTNVDLPIALHALCAELAGLADNRIRARRTIGAGARTPTGIDLAIS